MTMRPIPDLANAALMAKLGKLSALRSARADALHFLRDSCVRLQNSSSNDAAEISNCELALRRLREIERLETTIT